MKENWETHWEDYYQILGVESEANADDIRKAHANKNWILHTDRMKDVPEAARQQAEQELKRVNNAYDVLKDPRKRRIYHEEWLKRTAKSNTENNFSNPPSPKPKPEVFPKTIRIQDMKPGETRKETLIIKNTGGQFSKVSLSKPSSWIRIIRQTPLSGKDKLPLSVEIEVIGEDWGKSYADNIIVKLDDIETHVRVELYTLPKPANKRKYSAGLLISICMFFLVSLITLITYSYYSSRSVDPAPILTIPTNPQSAKILPVPSTTPQIPASPQPAKSIQTFRVLPFGVNKIIRQGETPDYVTIFLLPNSETQPNTEYGIQLIYRDTGKLRTQIKAIWSSGDIQSKKQLSIFMKATQDEINIYPIIAAYWDGVNISHQSEAFTVVYDFSLVTINNLTEQQIVDQKNQEIQSQYQQQLAQYQQQLINLAQQKQDITNQQNALNAQYLQRLSDRESQANKILFIFIPIDVIIFLAILFFIYRDYINKNRQHTERKSRTN